MRAIKRQRSCPSCGRTVGLRRMLLKCASSVWDCPGCGAQLEFDPGRRVAVAGYGTIFGLPPMIFGGMFHWWWGAAIGLAIYAFFMSYDSVRLKRPRA